MAVLVDMGELNAAKVSQDIFRNSAAPDILAGSFFSRKRAVHVERNLESYLLDIAREEVASKEAEIRSLRNSLRYRVGGWMLEAYPFGRRTLVVLWRLARLYLARLRDRNATGKPEGNLVLSGEAWQATTLVFGTTQPNEVANANGVWLTDNPKLMCMRLDSGPTAITLILCRPISEVARRIARAKLDGVKVIWWPEDLTSSDHALVTYLRAHADESRDMIAT